MTDYQAAVLQHRGTLTNLAWRAIQVLGKQGITFVIFFLTARLLNPFEFGLYNYTLAIIYLLIIFSDFGVSTTIAKLVAETADITGGALRKITGNAIGLILTVTAVVAAVTLLFGQIILGESYQYVLWLLPLIFLVPMTSLYDGIYRGQKKFRQLSLITITTGSFSVLVAYIFIQQFGLVGAFAGQIFFYSLLLCILVVGRKGANFRPDKKLLKNIVQYSLIIGVSNVSYFLYTRFDVIILGNLGLVDQIGAYEIANKVIIFLLVPIGIIAQVISPDVARHYANKSRQLVFKKTHRYMLIALLFSLVSTITLFFLYPLLLQTFLPAYFNASSITLMRVMLFVFIFQAVSYMLANGFSIYTGHALLNTKLLVFFGILNIILDIILIRSFGFNGLIATKLLIGLTSNILFIILYYRKIRMEQYYA